MLDPRTGQEAKLARELEQYTVRTEPLGHDRDLRAYYRFDGDNRIWVEEVRHVEVGQHDDDEEQEEGEWAVSSEASRALCMMVCLEVMGCGDTDCLAMVV